MDTVNIKINGVSYEVAAGSTILEAAHSVGIEIPTLCYLKEINAIGACRICVVEVKGAKSLVTACVYPVNDGMEITTNSAKVLAARRTNLELLLSTHDQNCLSCEMCIRDSSSPASTTSGSSRLLNCAYRLGGGSAILYLYCFNTSSGSDTARLA